MDNNLLQNTEILILAGGKGTRLQGVVSDRPKPMALINGVPFLELLIKRYIDFGFENFRLLTGYMHEFIENHFRENPLQANINYSVEDTPLGTAGCIRQALKTSKFDSFICLNGDTYFDFPFSDLSRSLELVSVDEDKVVLVLKRVSSAERYGTVNVEENAVITGFCEKQFSSGSQLINSGVYFFSGKIKSILRDESFSLEKEIFPILVEEKKLLGHEVDGTFIDIGIPEDYQRAQELIKIP